MGKDIAPLPEYDRSPVTEVIYGVVFEPIQAMLAPHFGLLWGKFRKEYPGCEEKPLVLTPGQPLNFGEVPPLPRIWFIHESSSRLIQVQRDRFITNWKEASLDEPYPGYDSLKKSYQQLLEVFTEFLRENEIGELKLKSAEMSYINHVPIGDVVASYDEVGKVFPDFRLREREGLSRIQGFNWVTVFELPDLGVTLNAVIRRAA